MKLFKRSRSAPKVQLAKGDEYRSKVIEKTADEYEYVPRDYGYDYAPPSLRVPAHSAASSTIQHHLSSMIYSEEPRSDISGNTRSAHSARHVDYKVQKPTSKSHWRPSEKEQRQIISEQQKRRRVERNSKGFMDTDQQAILKKGSFHRVLTHNGIDLGKTIFGKRLNEY
jgi:hypothetical protein